MMAVMGLTVELAAVKEAMLPVPLAAMPIAVLEFVQLYVAPVVVLVNAVAATVPLLHTLKLAGTVTVGVGFTVIV